MMSLVYVFWMYVVLFAIIGGMRGWAKELLVGSSVILALALNFVLRKYIPFVSDMEPTGTSLFWLRSLLVVALVYAGYQTVISIPHLAERAVRARLQDSLFGVLLGAINGYLVAGTLLFYLYEAKFPFATVISPPQAGSQLETTINYMMQYMAPHLLGEPIIYFAVILAFVFVIVVFV
jgi:hypothetical protein